MRNWLLYFCFIPVSCCVCFGEIKTLDFSGGDHSYSVFEDGDVELKPFKGIPYLRIIPSGTYEIILPGNIEYVIQIDRGEVRSGLDEEGYATTFKLFTDRLSLEAAKKLSYTFHEKFGISTTGLDEWFQKLEAGEAFSVYDQGGLGYNFPFLSMSLRTTFEKEQPAFAIYSISWDEKFAKRAGRSLSNNKELNVTYDMPELLEGVPEFTEVEEVEHEIVKIIPEGVEASDFETPHLFKREETPESTPKETSAEKSPANPWPWIMGALILLLAGLGFALRRKKSSS